VIDGRRIQLCRRGPDLVDGAQGPAGGFKIQGNAFQRGEPERGDRSLRDGRGNDSGKLDREQATPTSTARRPTREDPLRAPGGEEFPCRSSSTAPSVPLARRRSRTWG
jgi:hypothetical protein